MENIIDETYFWGELFIPNILSKNNSQVANDLTEKRINELRMFIAKYQKDYLIKMFGVSFANNMPDNLVQILKDDETKVSPIANYVYVKFQRNEMIKSTPTGDKTNQTGSSANVQLSTKIMDAFNEMQKLNIEIYQKIYDGLVEGIDFNNDIVCNTQFELTTTENLFGI